MLDINFLAEALFISIKRTMQLRTIAVTISVKYLKISLIFFEIALQLEMIPFWVFVDFK